VDTLMPERNMPNMHATCVVIGERGILITGPSGSGKSTLAMALMDDARRRGHFAACAGDDQIFLESAGGLLVARAPQATLGKLEVYGVGIVAVDAIPSAVIDLVAELVAPEHIERMPPERTLTLAGVDLPMLRVPRRQAALSAAMVLRMPVHGEGPGPVLR
jgi:HPr kinase/phosphorylase